MGRQPQERSLPQQVRGAERTDRLIARAAHASSGEGAARFDGQAWLDLCAAVRARVPSGRYRHCLSTARMAGRLAARHGADARKARVAGLVHDLARAWSADRLLGFAHDRGWTVTALERAAPVLLHARVGAALAKDELGVSDPEILSAVEHHTVAVSGMSVLERVVYLADAVEPTRGYPGRMEIFAATTSSLDAGMLAATKASIDLLVERGEPIAPETVALYDELVSRLAHTQI